MKYIVAILALTVQPALPVGITAHAKDSSAGSIDVEMERPIEATINGKSVRLTLAGDGLSYPVLNPDLAQRLSLKSSIVSVRATVGPVAIPGRTGVIKLGLDGKVNKRRALWFDKPISTAADGEIGPEALPHGVVRLILSPKKAGEGAITLPLHRETNRLGTTMSIGGRAIFVQFDPSRSHSLATASAAKLIGDAHGGRSGETRQEVIDFGVRRPVRRMTLERPLDLGGLKIASFGVRTSRAGGSVDAPAADADPDEIIVTASEKEDKRSRLTLTVGRDILGSCSNIVFDKAGRRIILSCG